MNERSDRQPARRARIHALGLAWVLALSGACASVAPPRAHATDYGEVRAESDELAAEVGAALEHLHPAVSTLLPDALDRPTPVWVQRELRRDLLSGAREHVSGFTVLERGRVHLREDDPELGVTLAHELVHALMGPSWEPLPAAMEEGVADWIADELRVHPRSHLRAARLIQAARFLGGAEVDLVVRDSAWRSSLTRVHIRLTSDVEPSISPEEILAVSGRGRLVSLASDLDEQETLGLYGLGYLLVARIVDRIGIQGLHQMCVLAREQGHEVVPLEWIWTEARIDPEEDSWAEVVGATLHRGDLRFFLDQWLGDGNDVVLVSDSEAARALERGLGVSLR